MENILLVQDMLTNMLLTDVFENGKYKVAATSSFSEAKEAIESADDGFCVAIIDLNLDDTKDAQIIDYLNEKGIRSIIYSDPADHSKIEDHIGKISVIDYVVKQTSEDAYYLLKIINNLKDFKELSVLIVDDSETTRKMLQEFIEPIGFQKIFEAGNGVEALETIKTHEKDNISLVITDFNMPKMDGFELTQNLRKRYDNDKLCIISITSEVSSEEASILLKFDVSGFLQKPYTKAHLNSLVHNEMDNLFTKQKSVKYQKELATFVRKLKTDSMTHSREEKQKLINLQKEFEAEREQLKKQISTLETTNELMKTKLKMQAEKLGMKKGEFKANEIKNV